MKERGFFGLTVLAVVSTVLLTGRGIGGRDVAASG